VVRETGKKVFTVVTCTSYIFFLISSDRGLDIAHDSQTDFWINFIARHQNVEHGQNAKIAGFTALACMGGRILLSLSVKSIKFLLAEYIDYVSVAIVTSLQSCSFAAARCSSN